MRKPFAVLLVAMLSFTAACGSDDPKPDCGDARKVARDHKAAAEAALAQTIAEQQNADPNYVAPTSPSDTLLKGFGAFDDSEEAKLEVSLYLATVRGNAVCFGAEERAQVDVLTTRTLRTP